MGQGGARICRAWARTVLVHRVRLPCQRCRHQGESAGTTIRGSLGCLSQGGTSITLARSVSGRPWGSTSGMAVAHPLLRVLFILSQYPGLATQSSWRPMVPSLSGFAGTGPSSSEEHTMQGEVDKSPHRLQWPAMSLSIRVGRCRRREERGRVPRDSSTRGRVWSPVNVTPFVPWELDPHR